jgi:N-acetylmuramoyl-L-alanine amidase
VAFVLLSSVVTFILCLGSINSGKALMSGVVKHKIVLDAGHGGVDAGATGKQTGVKESELNLMIVKKLEKYLLDAGFEVVLTRSTDAGLYGIATKNLKRKDMEKRREIIEKENPSMVISVHLNKYSLPSRRGAQVFYKEGVENSKILAESIQNFFNQLEESTREFNALKGDYFLLNCSSAPSVIAECGFLSNLEEEKLLITEEYQNKIAYAVMCGVVKSINEVRKNKPNLVKTLDNIDFHEIKWGKKRLFIQVGN